jgi:hypothetical protein
VGSKPKLSTRKRLAPHFHFANSQKLRTHLRPLTNSTPRCEAGEEFLIQGENSVDAEKAIDTRLPLGNKFPPQPVIGTQSLKGNCQSTRISFRENDACLPDHIGNLP